MGRSSPALVDVSDMLCAQALAIVAQAVQRAPAGAPVDVSFNTEDVRRDLCIWAREQGLTATLASHGCLRIQPPVGHSP